MAEIAPATPQATSALQRATSATQALANIEVTLLQAPDKIATTSRLIETTGLIQTSPETTSITLTTALGTLELTLAQLVNEREQQQIQQLLTTLYQRRTAVTLLIAPNPGSPQAQPKATLLLPETTNTSPQPLPTNNQPAISPDVASPLRTSPDNAPPASAPLRAIVLPSAPIKITPQSVPAQSKTASTDSIQTWKEQESPLAAPLAQPPAQGAISAYQTYDKALRIALNALQEVQNAALQNTEPATPPQPEPTLPPSQQRSTSALPPPTLPAGQEVFLRVSSATTSPSQKPQQPAPAQSPEWQDMAILETKGPDGQAILKASDTTFFVTANASPLAKAPVGSHWLVTLEPPSQSQPQSLPDTNAQQQPDPDSLPELLNALNQLDTTSASATMLPRFPIMTNNAQQLGTGLLFFFSALKGNDWHTWLGDNAAQRLAHIGQARLLDKLKETLKKNAQEEQSANGDIWQACSLPITEQDATNTATSYPVFYVRKDRQDSSRDDDNNALTLAQKNTRFLIDMNLSKLGAVQLDGLVGAKKMDLILRSEKLLPNATQTELKTLYENTLSAFGYAGLLQFQTDRSRWVIFKKAARPPPITT